MERKKIKIEGEDKNIGMEGKLRICCERVQAGFEI